EVIDKRSNRSNNSDSSAASLTGGNHAISSGAGAAVWLAAARLRQEGSQAGRLGRGQAANDRHEVDRTRAADAGVAGSKAGRRAEGGAAAGEPAEAEHVAVRRGTRLEPGIPLQRKSLGHRQARAEKRNAHLRRALADANRAWHARRLHQVPAKTRRG